MSKLSKILLALMALGSQSPYGSMLPKMKHKPKKEPKNNGKPISKVVYYTDENGKIKRKKVKLEATNDQVQAQKR